MAARKKEQRINLLPQEEFAQTTMGRALLWAMSSFRIIVIVTEMVVMLAFLSRFWLDARNVDLNDAIKQKSAIITATKDFENEFKDTQKRLKIFTELTQDKDSVSSFLASVVSYLPGDTSIISFAYNQKSIQVKASALTEISVAQFMTNLESSGSFEKVTLASLDSGQENDPFLTFSINLTEKGGS